MEDLRQPFCDPVGVSDHCSVGQSGHGTSALLHPHHDQNHLHQLWVALLDISGFFDVIIKYWFGKTSCGKDNKIRENVVGTHLWNSHGDSLYRVSSSPYIFMTIYLPFSPRCHFVSVSLLFSFWCDSAGESLWAGRNAPSFLYHAHHEWPGVRRNLCSCFHDLCTRQCVFFLFDLVCRFSILWLLY